MRAERCVVDTNVLISALLQPSGRTSEVPDGIRHWGYVQEMEGRALRIVTLADGETVHNAFPDRDFKEEPA